MTGHSLQLQSFAVLLQMTRAALFHFIAGDKTRNKNSQLSQLEVTDSAFILSHLYKIFLLHMILYQMRLVALKMTRPHVPEKASCAFLVT